MGSAALYQLSLRKAAVLGIDQFRPPHEFGSSHGDTRITRIACGEGREYSVFASRSHEIWRDLERKTGRGAADPERPAGHVRDRRALHGARNSRISAERPSTRRTPRACRTKSSPASTARRRFPAFNLRDDDTVYFDKVSGFVRPEACVQTQLELAEANGAVVRFNEAVTGFEQRGETVQVKTARATYTARQLIVAAGSWLPGLLAAGRREPFIVRRQVLYWFRAQGRTASTAFDRKTSRCMSGSCRRHRASTDFRRWAVPRTASSSRPRNIPTRPRRNRSIAACLRRKQRRCTKPMSRLIFRR